MADQDRQANVVLTADTSQYSQQVNTAARDTGSLSTAVDSLAKKLNDLSKYAGKKLAIFAASDTAAIVGTTYAYANFEHQMATLNAQAAVLNKTFGTAGNVIGTYEKAVHSLRTEFPLTTAEATQLVQVLSKFTSTGSDAVEKLAQTFVKAQGATGESASAMASSMLNLQKQMGTSYKMTSGYIDQAVSLAATTNTSVTALTDFASSLAPIGKMAGFTQTELMGVSTAFARAGADGTTAATAFNKILNDVTYAAQTGSPDLAKYANLVGMTSEQFKSIKGSEGILQIFDALNKMGPDAIQTLNRLGFDGMRTVKAISAVSSQAGGLRGAIGEAQMDYGNKSASAGADAGFGGLTNQMKKFTEQVKMMAEEIGSHFAPAMEGFTKGMTKAAQVVNSVLQGPLGKLLAWVMGAIAPIAGLTGGLLLAAGAIFKFAAAGALLRGSAMEGLRDSYRGARWGGGAANMPMPLNAFGQPTTPKIGKMGEKMLVDAELLAAGKTPLQSFPSRWMYQAGMGAGSMAFGAPADRVKGAISPLSRLMAYPLRGAAVGMDLLAQSISPGTMAGMADPTTRAKMIQSATAKQFYGMGKALTQEMSARAAGLPFAPGYTGPGGADPKLAETIKKVGRIDALKASGAAFLSKAGFSGYDPEQVIHKAAGSTQEFAKAASTAEKNITGTSKALGKVGGAFSTLIASMMSNVGSMGKQGMMLAAGGIKAIGSAALSSPQSLILPTMLAGMGAFMIRDKMKDKSEFKLDPGSMDAMSSYASIGGQIPVTPFSIQAKKVVPDNISLAEATTVTPADVGYATGDYQYSEGSAIEKYGSNDSGYEQWKRQVKAQYLGGGLAPQGIAAMVNDTIKRYGPTRGQEIADILKKPSMAPLDGAGYIKSISETSNAEGAGEIASRQLAATNARAAAAGAVSPKLGSQELVRDKNALLLGDVGRLSSASDRAAFEKGMGDFFAGSSYSMATDPNWGAGGTANSIGQAGLSAGIPSTPSGFGGAGQPGTGPTGYTGVGQPGTSPMAGGVNIGQALDAPNVKDMSPEEQQKYFYTKYLAGLHDDPKALADFYLKTSGVTSKENTDAQNVQALIDEKTAPVTHAMMFEGEQHSMRDLLTGTATGDPRTSLFTTDQMIEADLSADPNVQYHAITQNLADLKGGQFPGDQKYSNAQMMGTIQSGLSSGITEDGQMYGMLTTEQQIIQQNIANKALYQSRPQAFAAQGEANQAILSGLAGDPQEAEKRLALTQQQNDLIAQQYSYYKNLALARRELNVSEERGQEDFTVQRERMDDQYDLSRERAQEDFDLSRKYAEFDFNLSRTRSDFEFNLQRKRNQADFDRQQERSTADFYRGRHRQEEDFNHQQLIQAKQAAQSYYSVYERVKVQRTQDSSLTLQNSREQLTDLRTQKANLEKLRSMGVSDATIQQLGLTDPANAQQLARFVSDLQSHPGQVRQFNRVSQQRQRAAGSIAQDESSLDFQEQVHQMQISRQRGMQDFQRGMRQNTADFNRSMNQASDNYTRQMDQQADDFHRMMHRQETQFHTTMDRGEEDYKIATDNMVDDFEKQQRRAEHDLNRMATDITGSLATIMRKATNGMSKGVQDDMRDILQKFREFRPQLHAIMDGTVADVERFFGVEFHTTGIHSPGGNSPGGGAGPGGVPESSNGGGGSTPHVTRTRRKEPENKKEDPSVIFWPVPKGQSSVGRPFGFYDPQYATNHHTGQDFPANTGTPIFAVLPGSVETAGWDGAYGNKTALYHGKDHADRDIETWYAHQSMIKVHPGNEVEGGQHIGAVGETGNTQGAHLHLEYRIDGTAHDPMDLLGKGHVAYSEGDAGSGGKKKKFSVKEFMKKRYPQLEEAAKGLTIGGGFPDGWWSHKINEMTIRGLRRGALDEGTTLHQLIKENNAGSAGGHRYHGPDAPDHPAGNKRLGMQMAAARGWKGKEWDALYALWMKESGWKEHANNPTSSAYGIPQALPGSKMASAGADWHENPATQIKWGLNYIKSRYGDPISAWHHSQATNWYGEGGVFKGPKMIGIGERGPEVVLPLNHTGAEFISTLMSRMSVGQEARGMNVRGSVPMGCTHHTSNYKIDKSSTFTGAISVTANDPREFFHSVRDQQRHSALSAPSLSSS